MELDRTVHFSPFIQSVSLPDFTNNTDCWVTGWGDISDSARLSSPYTLQQVQLPIIGNQLCNKMYKGDILPEMMCAGLKENSGVTSLSFSLQDYPGAPLVCKKTKCWVLAGIMSFGEQCARPGSPGIYTRVCSYLDWIKSQI
ncbi:TRYB2 Tryptase, partial [Amia calva]|nr:TRYB2 Tryptase [Amia calva]